ncbi:hypothetical protein V8G54_015056 [Vigna mungo]|uniref:Uncharacterized protein n=1 Tax=Vigna mungo TaxID=3915 RepID=A0AAQ3NIQ2_VIGMU
MSLFLTLTLTLLSSIFGITISTNLPHSFSFPYDSPLLPNLLRQEELLHHPFPPSLPLPPPHIRRLRQLRRQVPPSLLRCRHRLHCCILLALAVAPVPRPRWRLRRPLRYNPLLRSPNLLLQPRHGPAGDLLHRALRSRSGLLRRRRNRRQRHCACQLRETLLRLRPVGAGLLQRLRPVRPLLAVRFGIPNRPE